MNNECTGDKIAQNGQKQMSQTGIGDGFVNRWKALICLSSPRSYGPLFAGGDCGKVKRLRSGYAAAQPDVMIDEPVLVQSAAF